MSLPVLAVLVLGGISAIIVSIHLSGGTRDARLRDQADALARFAEDFPDDAVDFAWLTADRHAAFLALAGQRTGIVQSFGDRFIARIHDAGEDRIAKSGRSGLTLATHDFTWRGGTFEFADEAARDSVMARLAGREA